MNRPWNLALGCVALGGVAFGCTGVVTRPGAGEPGDLATLRCEDRPYASASEMRRLTGRQYERVIEDVFAGVVAPSPRYPAPGLAAGQTYSTEAGLAEVSRQNVEEIMVAAEDVALEVAEETDALLTCSPGRACAGTFLDQYGRRAFRRVLREDERTRLLGVYDAASADGATFDESIALMTAEMLQMPSFLYVVEEAAPTARPLTGVEMASRLSFMLLDSIPDEALLAAAERGDLADPENLRTHARRLLDSPRADTVIARLIREWTGTREITGDDVRRQDPDLATDDVADSMNESFDRFAVATVRDGTMHDMLRSADAYVDANLAAFFGVEAPSDGWARVTLPADRASGLMTQPALLASLTSATRYVHRGRFVIEGMLCEPLGAAPANAMARAEDIVRVENPTSREQAALISASPDCGSCHSRINPIGLAFEHFDGLGRFEAADADGRAIDPAGFATIGDRRYEFADHVELLEQLADEPQVSECFARQVFRFSMSRREDTADLCAVQDIERALTESGGDVEEALLAMVVSDAFRMRIDPR